MNTAPSICVLMGGPSAEHEISLKSGRGVLEALGRRGWNPQTLVIPQGLTVDEAVQCVRVALERGGVEVAFLALHGPFGEDGTIQQLCEELGIAYTGSGVLASRLGLDKVASRTRFVRAGLRVPSWRLLDVGVEPLAETTPVLGTMTVNHDMPPRVRGGVPAVRPLTKLRQGEDTVERGGSPAAGGASEGGNLGFPLRGLTLPVVVKPTQQGSSIGVSVVTQHAELMNAMKQASRYDRRILVEEFVAGRELTVGILGQQALPIVEIKPAQGFFDYTAKYTPGCTTYEVPAVLGEELARQVQAAALRAHQVLRCRDFSRVDLILDAAQQPVILEVNTIPGLTTTSLLPKAAACVGISYDELCERLVSMACRRLPASPAQPLTAAVAQHG